MNCFSDNSLAEKIRDDIKAGNFLQATEDWNELEDVVISSSNAVVGSYR